MHAREDTAAIDAAMTELGVVTSKQDPDLRREMAYGMFDTRGRVRELMVVVGGCSGGRVCLVGWGSCLMGQFNEEQNPKPKTPKP